MVIVYKSNTGFTKEYAEMLGRAEKMKVCELSQARRGKETEVFYMGPLMAGHIGGVDQAVKCFDVKGVCGVGMTAPENIVFADLCKVNYVPNAPIFYLQGGWAPKKVGWLKRRMVNMATRSRREALQAKGSRRTPEEQAELELMLEGGSRVAFENLSAIRGWMEEHR